MQRHDTNEHSCAESMWTKDPGEPGNRKPCGCGRIYEHRDLTWWQAMFMPITGSVPAQFAGSWVCVGREEAGQ